MARSKSGRTECRLPQSRNGSRKHHDFPLDDDSFLSLGTKMVEILRVEARVLSLDCKDRMTRHRTLTLKEVFIGFLLGLSDLSPPWA